MATMTEVVHEQEQAIKSVLCGYCNQWTTSQVYTIRLERPRVTRTWNFCSLPHLRAWSAPY